MKKVISLLLVLMLAVSSMTFTVSAEDEKFDTVNLKQFDKLPNIDGSISNAEWGQPVKTAKYTADTTSVGTSHTDTAMQFQVWMGYTFEGLYLAVKNEDSQHFNSKVPGDLSHMYEHDCMQLRIDEKGCTVDQGIMPSATRGENWSDKMSEFGFALGNDGSTYSHAWAGPSKGDSLVSGNGRYEASNAGGYTTYELFIPWENIVEEAPHIGSKFGLTIGMWDVNSKGVHTNWLEWGSGEYNTRQVNICGSNRIVFTDETIFGGAPEDDPNPPEGGTVTDVIIPDATGDYIKIDAADIDVAHSKFMYSDTNADNENYVDLFYEANTEEDWFITYQISQKVKAQAEDYKYLALFMKSNTTANSSRIYYTTSENNQVTQENSMPFWLDATEDAQIYVIDMTMTGGWDGRIGSLRLDFVNPEEGAVAIGSAEEFVTTIYGIALFKNENDAKTFNVSAEDYPVLPNKPAVETTPDITDTPDNDTTAPGNDTTKPADKSDDTTKAPTTTNNSTTNNNEGSMTWLWIVIGVVAVAAIGAGVFFFIKKKKA